MISLADPYRGHGLDVADLVEEGNLGLMRAVDKYDSEMGGFAFPPMQPGGFGRRLSGHS